jgi:cytochrome c-type biogenesis protein CcsB
MESLVKLSFYSFTATTIALIAAAVCYIIYAVGFIRLRRSAVAVAGGPAGTATITEISYSSGPMSLGRFGTMLAWFAVVFQAMSVLFRFLASKSAPSNMYEFSLIFVLIITALYLIFERTYGARQVGAIVLPIAVGMVAYIWSLPAEMREINPLIPALQNQTLMSVHVGSAIFAYAAFSVAFAAAVLYLIAANRNVAWLPSADLLDDLGFRAVTVGFPLMTATLILGSVWAHEAWGAYWQWDPKETSALFLWLVYAVYLHTRSLHGWHGNRSAYILLFGFAATIFTYFGNYVFGGLHAYGGV